MRMRTVNLVAEVLFIGVLVCLTSLPVVTVLASAAAGATQLRDCVGGDGTSALRRHLALVRAASRDPFAVLAPAALLVIGGLGVLSGVCGFPRGRRPCGGLPLVLPRPGVAPVWGRWCGRRLGIWVWGEILGGRSCGPAGAARSA